jgi:hypothetical protein
VRLIEQAVAKDDPDPKALACYGLLLRPNPATEDAADQMWLRFVDGRPVSSVTVAYLDWCCRKLHAAGKDALCLIWDNAPWHVSQHVRAWIRGHNRGVKQRGDGVRIIACYLPIKSPWLNAIEATWVHGKRRVLDADRLLTIDELADRVADAYGCPHEPHLVIPEKAAWLCTRGGRTRQPLGDGGASASRPPQTSGRAQQTPVSWRRGRSRRC